MIISERKPLNEIISMLSGCRRILIAGCRSCAAVCLAGGDREVSSLSEALKLYASVNSLPWSISETAVERQCEKEWAQQIASADADAVVSLGCGVGVQCIQELCSIPVFPGLNTMHMGAPSEQGIYEEKCAGCGSCTLHVTGGVCPVARCAKSMLNGPCGGSQNGKCEVNGSSCAWDLIYKSLSKLGRLEQLSVIIPPKDWSTSHSGGVRKTVRRDMVLSEEEKKIREGLE